MPKIAVLSDLHLEFDRALMARGGWHATGHGPRANGHPALGPDLRGLREMAPDLVILAGDIDLGTEGIVYADALAAYLDAPIVYIAGNHEFYGFEINETRAELSQGANGDRIRLLENSVARYQLSSADIRILGATLWTDFGLFGGHSTEIAMQFAALRMTDFAGGITLDGERFRPEQSADLHMASVRWLEGTLAQPFDGTTIVATHHCPSPNSVSARFKNDPLTPAFASNLDDLILAAKPALWVHGHTHDFFDYRLGDTRVVCNPRGYVPDAVNPDFEPDLVVEL